jgi:hypothetical protein
MSISIPLVAVELALIVGACAWIGIDWYRHRRFSLRALLGATTLTAFALLVIVYHVIPLARHRLAIHQIHSAGGEVIFRDWLADGRRTHVRHVAADGDKEALVIARQLDRLPEVNAVALYRGVSDAGLAAICQIEPPLSLEQMYVDPAWRITNSGLAHLASLQELQTLVLQGLGIDDAGAAHFKSIRGLRNLSLEQPSHRPLQVFTEKGFAEIGELIRLETLTLGCLQISDESARNLHRLKHLKTLRLKACGMSDQALADLREALPHCDIVDQDRRRTPKSVGVSN